MASLNEPAPAAADEFLISRVFNASSSTLFDLWTQPGHLARWWGPKGFTNPVCEVDARPGGMYRLTTRSPKGDEFPLKGSFLEVSRPLRLVMTMDCSGHPAEWHDAVHPGRDRGRPPAMVMHQTVTFEESDGRTRMTIRTKFDSAAIRDAVVRNGMDDGWSQSLDRLEQSASEAAAHQADRELLFSRELRAPRELVFRAWTDPEQVGKWWGPRGFTTTTEVMEVRRGGEWRHIMHGPDGTDYPNRTVYVEVAPPERLVYTNGGGKPGESEANFQTTVRFESLASGGTRITMRMVFPTREMRDMVVKVYGAVEGAHQTLERLESHLSGGRPG